MDTTPRPDTPKRRRRDSVSDSVSLSRREGSSPSKSSKSDKQTKFSIEGKDKSLDASPLGARKRDSFKGNSSNSGHESRGRVTLTSKSVSDHSSSESKRNLVVTPLRTESSDSLPTDYVTPLVPKRSESAQRSARRSKSSADRSESSHETPRRHSKGLETSEAFLPRKGSASGGLSVDRRSTVSSDYPHRQRSDSSLDRRSTVSESAADLPTNRVLFTSSLGSPLGSPKRKPFDSFTDLAKTSSSAYLTQRSVSKPLKPKRGSGSPALPPDSPFDAMQMQHDQCLRNGIATYVNDSNQKMIYGGKPRFIILQLLDWLLTEPKRSEIYHLIDIFLFTYRKYYTPLQLLQISIALWSETAENPEEDKEFEDKRKSSVLLFLSEWFELQYCHDFRGDVLKVLEEWLKSLKKNFRNPLIAKIQLNVKTAQAMNTPSVYLFEPLKEDPVFAAGKFGFVDLKPRHIADEWTMLDLKNFQELTQNDFLLEPDQQSYHWTRMLNRSHTFQRWVASEIVQTLNLSKRVEVIKRFLQLALRFIENNNFNGLMALWGGLNMVSVHRLAKTRKKLPKQFEDIWAALEDKLSESSNFGKMRAAIDKQVAKQEPLVPWFELINKVRNWNEQIYEDFYEQDGRREILNFNKMFRLGEQIAIFRKIQKINSVIHLNFEINKTTTVFRNYLEHLPTYEDEVLWKFSLQCEPEVAQQS